MAQKQTEGFKDGIGHTPPTFFTKPDRNHLFT
jgi:hypothetical protein